MANKWLVALLRVLAAIDTRDIIGIGGFFALIYGVGLVSAPAAWITAGLLLLLVWAQPLLRTRSTKG